MHPHGGPGMLSLQVPATFSAAKVLSHGGAGRGQAGRGAAGALADGNGAGAKAAAARQAAATAAYRNPPGGTCPGMQPLRKSRDGKSLLDGYAFGGSLYLPRDDRLEMKSSILERDNCGRHFLFDERIEKNRRLVPPLPKHNRMHRSGNLHRLSLPKELPHSRSVQPFTLHSCVAYDMNTGPAMLFPSALVLNDRSTFSVDACRLDRPRVSYATCNPFAIGDNQKNLSYPDPMVGASHSFIHRMSELSCLEGETVRQEKLKSIRKTRKHDS